MKLLKVTAALKAASCWEGVLLDIELMQAAICVALTYCDIVPNDSGQCSVCCIVLCYVHHNIVLDIAVVANLDVVHVACNQW